ncbi:MAG TPA: alpha/beta fold hydrolase [Gaiellaceae bacterium]|nr:alpha/beta fold hydrolase [Gaiellaceae bacterium]
MTRRERDLFEDLSAKLARDHASAGREGGLPVWFGAEERPLFGWLHHPGGGVARGSVVICPPVGKELAYAQGNLRLLALELAAEGFLVVRFDYDGTGDSAGGDDDPGRVEAWLASIEHAVELARRAAPGPVAGVGLRLGGTLVANVASETGLFDALVLWDPCLSGASFLREQRALLSVSLHEGPAEESPRLEIPGHVLTAETAEALGRLRQPAGGRSLAAHVLLLTDPARPGGKRLFERMAAPEVEWQEYCEPSVVFDTSELTYEPPRAVLRQIVEWLALTCEGASRPVAPVEELPLERSATVPGPRYQRVPVREQAIELGPAALFGIESTPADRHSAGPTILLACSGAESHIGPARLWVDVARELAADGSRVIRFDLSGLGESPPRPGRAERVLYAREALDDVLDAAHAASPDEPGDVVLAGLCSSAYAALTVAPRLRPQGVVAINPILTFPAFREPSPAGSPGWRRTLRRIVADPLARVRAAAAASQEEPWRRALARRLPRAAWWLIFRLTLSHSPDHTLLPVLEARVPVLLICGEPEAQPLQLRVPGTLGRLAALGSRLEVIGGLDHALLVRAPREAARAILVRHLREAFPHGSAARAAGALPDRLPADEAPAAPDR